MVTLTVVTLTTNLVALKSTKAVISITPESKHICIPSWIILVYNIVNLLPIGLTIVSAFNSLTTFDLVTC